MKISQLIFYIACFVDAILYGAGVIEQKLALQLLAVFLILSGILFIWDVIRSYKKN
jgi:hypothetical protein